MPDSERHLKHPPLAEALLEVKWALETRNGQEVNDPGYPLIVGRLYDRLAPAYPEVEHLVPQEVPASVTLHMVRHRFRKAKGQWPLVQVGPGVLTLNEACEYRWRGFKERAIALLPKLYEAYPTGHALPVNSLLLRYINTREFDFEKADVLEFLQSKMRTKVGLPGELFANGTVQQQPLGLRLNLTFPLAEPKGVIDINFGVGKSGERPALIWEFLVRSRDADVPRLPDGFPAWLKSAHDVIELWFFELAKGDLQAEFDKP